MSSRLTADQLKEFQDRLTNGDLPGLSGTVAANILSRGIDDREYQEYALTYLLGIQDALSGIGGHNATVELIRRIRTDIKSIVHT